MVRGTGEHLLLYDGVCALCNGLVTFVLRRDPRGVFSFASLQSEVGKMMVARASGDPAALTSFYVIAEFRTPAARVMTKSDAVLFVARELGWPWRLASAGVVLPGALRNWLYDVVARHRYRMFGCYEQCLMPSEEFRRRFID